jgi:hypothetical protein
LRELTSTGGTEMQERKRLEDIIKKLPEDLRKELEDFAH